MPRCPACGKPLRKGALFCGYCGRPVQEGCLCPACGAEARAEVGYCEACGARLSGRVKKPPLTPVITPKPETPEEKIPVPKPEESGTQPPLPITEKEADPESRERKEEAPPADLSSASRRELVVIKMMSWYPGESKMGIAKAVGTLTVYPDRVELRSQLGDALKGLKRSGGKREDGPLVYWMRDIASAEEGKFGETLPSLLLTLHSGEKHTFAGTFSREKIRDSVGWIQRYCRR